MIKVSPVPGKWRTFSEHRAVNSARSSSVVDTRQLTLCVVDIRQLTLRVVDIIQLTPLFIDSESVKPHSVEKLLFINYESVTLASTCLVSIIY